MRSEGLIQYQTLHRFHPRVGNCKCSRQLKQPILYTTFSYFIRYYHNNIKHLQSYEAHDQENPPHDRKMSSECPQLCWVSYTQSVKELLSAPHWMLSRQISQSVCMSQLEPECQPTLHLYFISLQIRVADLLLKLSSQTVPADWGCGVSGVFVVV